VPANFSGKESPWLISGTPWPLRQSQLPAQGWDTLIRALMLQRVWDEDKRDIVLTMANHVWRPTGADTTWIFGHQWDTLEVGKRRRFAIQSDYCKLSEWRREAHFVCGRRGDMVTMQSRGGAGTMSITGWDPSCTWCPDKTSQIMTTRRPSTQVPRCTAIAWSARTHRKVWSCA
jgi:hypothetical protein